MASAFVYGTLMLPKILKGVLNNDASHLQICPAILTGHTRHKLKTADFPALLPVERSKTLLGREPTAEENNVCGMLVMGLTTDDMDSLNLFEGGAQSYERVRVCVHPLGPLTPVPVDVVVTPETTEDSLIQTALSPLAANRELAQPTETYTYVWRLKDNWLEKEMWSFDEFVRKNAWKWDIIMGSGAKK